MARETQNGTSKVSREHDQNTALCDEAILAIDAGKEQETKEGEARKRRTDR